MGAQGKVVRISSRAKIEVESSTSPLRIAAASRTSPTYFYSWIHSYEVSRRVPWMKDDVIREERAKGEDKVKKHKEEYSSAHLLCALFGAALFLYRKNR
jgi:hypothetical protein